jgi:Glyoxalase/Bleomycin resistance protein/Dioxygenase superfamily
LSKIITQKENSPISRQDLSIVFATGTSKPVFPDLIAEVEIVGHRAARCLGRVKSATSPRSFALACSKWNFLKVMSDTPSIHPDARIGHVHLKVADLDRALAFYCGVLGFQLTQRYGRDAAFISAGGIKASTK